MKKTILTAVLVGIFLFAKAQETVDQAANNNQFCFELFNYINPGDDNLFLSPFSVSTALAMTYEGARGKTQDEMSKILHFPSDRQANNKNFQDIISRVQSSKDAKDYTFNIANSIWAQKDYKFLQNCC